MPRKIKILIFALALIALVSVLSFSKAFKKIPSYISAGVISSDLSFKANNDPDHDGLNNREESYWNTDPNNPDSDGDKFLDGEEVASGHHPLKPGPDDLLVNNNVTKKISELAIGGLVDGSLKPSNPNYSRSVNLVVDEILYQSQINSSLTLPPLNTVENSPENIKKYGSEVLPFLEAISIRDLDKFFDLLETMGDFDLSNPASLIENQKLRSKTVDATNQEILALHNQIKRLQAMSVPRKFTDAHLNLIIYFESIRKNYTLFQKVEDDPVQSLVALNTLVNLFISRLPEVVNEFVGSITSSATIQ